MTPIALDALAALVPDGSLVALAPDYALPACALAHALVRRGARGLRLIGVPTSGYATDVLIGAGCVAAVETSAASIGESGLAPRFAAALSAGTIEVIDATCPAIHTMLQAAEKGVPFMPLRGVLGSDLRGAPAGLEGDRQPVLPGPMIQSCCCRRWRPTSRCFTRSWPMRTAMSMSAAGANSRRWRTRRNARW